LNASQSESALQRYESLLGAIPDVNWLIESVIRDSIGNKLISLEVGYPKPDDIRSGMLPARSYPLLNNQAIADWTRFKGILRLPEGVEEIDLESGCLDLSLAQLVMHFQTPFNEAAKMFAGRAGGKASEEKGPDEEHDQVAEAGAQGAAAEQAPSEEAKNPLSDFEAAFRAPLGDLNFSPPGMGIQLTSPRNSGRAESVKALPSTENTARDSADEANVIVAVKSAAFAKLKGDRKLRFEGDANFIDLIMSVMDEETIEKSPHVALLVSRLMRSLVLAHGKSDFKAQDKKKGRVSNPPSTELDEYESPDERTTLKVLQTACAFFNLAPLSSLLIKAKGDDLQFEGLKMGCLLTKNMNKTAQKKLVKLLSGIDRDYPAAGQGVPAALGKIMRQFISDLPGLRDAPRLQAFRLLSSSLLFLQVSVATREVRLDPWCVCVCVTCMIALMCPELVRRPAPGCSSPSEGEQPGRLGGQPAEAHGQGARCPVLRRRRPHRVGP
jgi:hypothetical protein